MAQNSINPFFNLPPNVVDLGYEDEVFPTSDYPDDAVADVAIDDTEGSVDDETYAEGGLLPPNYVTVVSQTTRVTSGGTVVDVVLDVEDVAGFNQFEVRVTK